MGPVPGAKAPLSLLGPQCCGTPRLLVRPPGSSQAPPAAKAPKSVRARLPQAPPVIGRPVTVRAPELAGPWSARPPRAEVPPVRKGGPSVRGRPLPSQRGYHSRRTPVSNPAPLVEAPAPFLPAPSTDVPPGRGPPRLCPVPTSVPGHPLPQPPLSPVRSVPPSKAGGQARALAKDSGRVFSRILSPSAALDRALGDVGHEAPHVPALLPPGAVVVCHDTYRHDDRVGGRVVVAPATNENSTEDTGGGTLLAENSKGTDGGYKEVLPQLLQFRARRRPGSLTCAFTGWPRLAPHRAARLASSAHGRHAKRRREQAAPDGLAPRVEPHQEPAT